MGYRISRLQDFAGGVRASKALLDRERWPQDRLERFRQERLQALTRHAAEHAPFWRARIPRGRVELSQIEPTSKADLMDSFDEMVTDPRLRLEELLVHLGQIEGDALLLGEYRVMTSSGSSGRKAVFVYDRSGWQGIMAQFLRRSEWTGAKPRLPRLRLATIGGTSPTHMSRRIAQTLDIGLHRLLALDVSSPIEELVTSLNEFRPNHLNGYPSVMAQLAEERLAGRLRIEPEAIFTNSEPLSATLRARLEEAFGVRAYNFYATTEGLYGHDCPNGSMHLFDDMCIVENVDEANRPVPPGEVGARLLVTNLFNRVQPLIRFEVSDLVALEPEPCTCGRSLARVRSLEGRAEEVLQVGDVTVHPMQFALVTADPDVREFQVVQERDALRLRVAFRNGSAGAPARLRERVSTRLDELGVSGCSVTVETVDALERSPGGKLQMIVPRRESIRGSHR
jgi:phenylacetate-coenzyme A ligase PaaK-like adenylate-forming protein